MWASLSYPCHVRIDVDLTPLTVNWIKREAERNGAPFYALAPEKRDMMISKYGFVEGVHFSCEPDPIEKLDGEITFRDGVWKEVAYG